MSQSERSEQEQVRFEKLAELREQGFIYPNDVSVSGSSEDIKGVEVKEPEDSERQTIAGRIVQLRLMGKAAFCHLLDGKGKVQVYVRKDEIGDESFAQFKKFDIGDIVECSGYVFVTKTGEKTLHVEKIRLLTKCLIPPPDKWHGLSDVEVRYRNRYIDLFANPDVRETFWKRTRIIREIRNFFDDRGYMEVETPVLSYVAGGAAARPFETYYNALSCDMFLRIALELPLKKLVVGGVERVYEIGRNFRNEGLSTKHNPEFSMLEFYQAYATFEDLMDLTEELVTGLSETVNGSLKIPFGEKEVDLTPPWPRLSMEDSIHEIGGIDSSVDLRDMAAIHTLAGERHIELDDKDDWGKCIDNLWEELVEPNITNPVFITRHPLSISPLARKKDDDPLVTDRFELIIAGMEMANAFSELNDPEDQRERFEEQARRKEAGDEEATDIDHDFLRALEVGLPPTAGQGIGIDRLVMLLTNTLSIRDVILFPQLKVVGDEPEPEAEETE